MKTTISILAFLLCTSFGFAQQLTYSKNHNGDTVAKDQYGNVVAMGSLGCSLTK